ncbi:MAG: AAA family ATPase [Clostridium fessum]
MLTGCLLVFRKKVSLQVSTISRSCRSRIRVLTNSSVLTDTEVRKLLLDYHLEDRFEEVKEWYDGYRFGNADVYCPWDVINFVDRAKDDKEAKPEAY